MSEQTVVLVNPSSRSGETGQRVPELERLLSSYLGEFRLLRTELPGDGERLAREAAERGATRLIIAGGDGTVSEALSGLLSSSRSSAVELGLLPLGTGRDFARLLKLGTDLEAAVSRISFGKKRAVDAGRIRCRARDGSERTRCFLNIASFGLSGQSALWLDAQGKRGRRGPLSYVLSGFVGLARYAMPNAIIRVDGVVVHDGRLTLAAVANGQYFAGGMRVSPDARIDDGLFDVVTVGALPMASSLALFPKLIRGKHVKDSRVTCHRGLVVQAESDDEVWIEADGEPIGTLPATIELLPNAITLCGMP